jgi:integrase
VCGLRWEDIDLAAGTVTIGRARVLVNARVIVKESKSERGYRTLPLDKQLTAALQSLRKQQATERLAAGQAYQATGDVVADELGAAPSPEWFSDEFHRLAATAGVPRIRLHDGRHTVNSLMEMSGVASAASFAGSGERELPAVQPGAMGRVRSPREPMHPA